MKSEDLLAYCLAKPGAWPDEPWEGALTQPWSASCPGRTVRSSPKLAFVTANPEEEAVPAIPVSAGALIFDQAGQLLILKPTYKTGWTIPGGIMEADGETPWEACRREVREECGIELHEARLACMDFRRPKPGRMGGVRFLFDCGRVSDQALAGIVVQPEEISGYRFAAVPDALDLLRGPIRRRVRAATGSERLVYLEDGRPVPGVGKLAGV
jgi:8-oxo-dGTP diphosphatase